MQKVYVLDFDGVLFDQFSTRTMYTEAIAVLHHLRSQMAVCAIATRRSSPHEVAEVMVQLEQLNLIEMFACVIADHQPKPYHMQKIKDIVQEKYPDASLELHLYDDFDVNIRDVINAGYQARLIDNRFGLRFSDFQ